MNRLEIAERIKKLIEENPVDGKPLSSYKLAQMGIISSSTLSNALNGQVKPNKSSLSKLAEFYHVSVDWIMTGSEPELTNETNDSSRLIAIIDKLSASLSRRDDEIERLTKIIERLTFGTPRECEQVNDVTLPGQNRDKYPPI